MPQTNPPPYPPPWWAGLIALAFAAVIGFAMILIGALVVSDTAAAALLISSGTAAVVGVGIRASGRTARAERAAAAKRSDESGRAGVGLLAALATLGLYPLLAWLTSSRESKTFQTQWIGDRPPRGSMFRMAFLGWVRVTESGPGSLTVQRCSRLVSGWLGLVHWMRARGALAFAAVLSVGVVLLALALGGCAWQTRRDGDTLGLAVKESPSKPPPGCVYTWTIDGKMVLEGEGRDCSNVRTCVERKP